MWFGNSNMSHATNQIDNIALSRNYMLRECATVMSISHKSQCVALFSHGSIGIARIVFNFMPIDNLEFLRSYLSRRAFRFTQNVAFASYNLCTKCFTNELGRAVSWSSNKWWKLPENLCASASSFHSRTTYATFSILARGYTHFDIIGIY